MCLWENQGSLLYPSEGASGWLKITMFSPVYQLAPLGSSTMVIHVLIWHTSVTHEAKGNSRLLPGSCSENNPCLLLCQMLAERSLSLRFWINRLLSEQWVRSNGHSGSELNSMTLVQTFPVMPCIYSTSWPGSRAVLLEPRSFRLASLDRHSERPAERKLH